jgi:hypothetical protein
MSNGGHDRGLEAFRRLLADARLGGQAKVDALLALGQRTVWVAAWGPAHEGFRTLTNSDGATALPVFTSEGDLASASEKFGWSAPGGPAGREVGAREALRHAIAHNLEYVIVDIGSEHTLEIERSEIEPMMTPEARRESATGPFAGVGRISSTMMKAVKATPPPGELPPAKPRITATTADPTQARPDATFGSGSSVTMSALTTEPPDEALEALSELFRGYPEVEWACIGSVARGPSASVPAIGLRVDPAFRQRAGEIVASVRRTADEKGASLDVILLDDPQVMRTARQVALVFYPWRR